MTLATASEPLAVISATEGFADAHLRHCGDDFRAFAAHGGAPRNADYASRICAAIGATAYTAIAEIA